jgi:Uma2 family endonuclease
MVQTSLPLLTFEAFVAQYGDNEGYELIDGELFEMEPTGPHEEVTAFILRKLNVQIDQLNLYWFTPSRCLIKPLGLATAFRPDLIVLDKVTLVQEPFWRDQPIVTLGTSIKLVVEVVSTNWQNDYARKVEDYAALGIPEYWVVDYAALGGRQFIGYPKQPTFSIYTLTGSGDYQLSQFRGSDLLYSSAFPGLSLRAEQVLNLEKPC